MKKDEVLKEILKEIQVQMSVKKPVITKEDMNEAGIAPSWKKIGLSWKENLKELWWSSNYSGELPPKLANGRIFDNRLFDLKQLLLTFGGEEVCLPVSDCDLTEILEYGQVWDGKRIVLKRGNPSCCHGNAADYYQRNYKTAGGVLRIATGYALSKDGMWRQHSWLVLKKARSYQIIETTEPRVLYFGFAMSEEMAEVFCEYNFI